MTLAPNRTHVELAEVDGVALEEGARGRALRDTYGSFPSGVVAVCADVEDEGLVGMAVSSFTSVSLEPALVSICLDKGSSTWPKLRSVGRLGVSVLSTEHEKVARQLSSRSGDRFAGVEVQAIRGGAVLLHDASAWLECTIHDEVDAGDHVIALLQVVRYRTQEDAEPLVFHASRFRSLVAVS
jgi:flavin reductase (DIM6/NTAB) family NADH-FMN oxidoreductase RutF